MILADTGFFVAFARPRDELHDRAVSWAEALSEPLLVTKYILWEVVNALSAPVERSKAQAFARHVRLEHGYKFVPATAALTDAGLILHADRPDKSWSLTDCISFLLMEERGLRRALSHDHDFEQAGFEALLRRDPP